MFGSSSTVERNGTLTLCRLLHNVPFTLLNMLSCSRPPHMNVGHRLVPMDMFGGAIFRLQESKGPS